MANDISRIAALLLPQQVLLDVDAGTQAQALEIAAATMAQANALDPMTVFHALARREQAGSTGLGGGIAIPHARVRGIAQPLTLFMRTRLAIAFHAPDGRPVSQLLVILAPVDGAKQDHLELLALVAKLFSSAGFSDRLSRAVDASAAVELFRAGIAKAATVS